MLQPVNNLDKVWLLPHQHGNQLYSLFVKVVIDILKEVKVLNRHGMRLVDEQQNHVSPRDAGIVHEAIDESFSKVVRLTFHFNVINGGGGGGGGGPGGGGGRGGGGGAGRGGGGRGPGGRRRRHF